VPVIIGLLLTPRAFAYWSMNDAGYRDLGMILHTNSFTKTDVMLLISVLDSNFGIKATIRVAGKKMGYLCTSSIYAYNLIGCITIYAFFYVI